MHFAGLAPGFVGLYQVNVEIPAGVEPGLEVPLVLFQNGVPSNTVTVAVQQLFRELKRPNRRSALVSRKIVMHGCVHYDYSCVTQLCFAISLYWT